MSDKYSTGPNDIVAEIRDIKQRLSVLERVPSLSSASIDSGGVTVKGGNIRVTDPDGVVRVVLGLLSDASYGLEVLESAPAGNVFHQVPYVYTSFVATGETCTSTTYGDLATVGPQVTVPVGSSGRILVQASAQPQFGTPVATNNKGDGRFDVAFSGANTRTPNEASDPLVGVWSQTLNVNAPNTTTYANVNSVTTQAVFENLNPGLTTITMKYRNGTGTTVNTDFFRRVLTVFRL